MAETVLYVPYSLDSGLPVSGRPSGYSQVDGSERRGQLSARWTTTLSPNVHLSDTMHFIWCKSGHVTLEISSQRTLEVHCVARAEHAVIRSAGVVSVATPGSFRVEGVWLRARGLGFQVQGSGLRVKGFGFRAQGFSVEGLGCRV